jgi:hypothetical protein
MSERKAFVVHARAELVGEEAVIALTVELPVGVHIEPHEPAEPYLIPTVLDVEDLLDVTVEYPRPVAKSLGWNDLELTVLQGSVEFLVRGRVPPGLERVSGTLRYQPCVGGACLPPQDVTWQSPLEGATTYSVLGTLIA